MLHQQTIDLRQRLALADPCPVTWTRADAVSKDGYTRERVEYHGLEGDLIPALLFTPTIGPVRGGVVVFHQHNGEFHLGKSEVAGIAGDRFQAFGPALAREGIVVLAPDAITFEDRRTCGRGIEPHEDDWLQHYNAMAYRLVNGDLLMRKALDDAQRAISVLTQVAGTPNGPVGVIGHSYGGTTALYLAAIDQRCRFACISGALCSLAARQAQGTGIGMFELVPGLASRMDAHDLLQAITPRPTFIVSATQDPYSADAVEVVARVQSDRIATLRVEGTHALDQPRFDAIVTWSGRTVGDLGDA